MEKSRIFFYCVDWALAVECTGHIHKHAHAHYDMVSTSLPWRSKHKTECDSWLGMPCQTHNSPQICWDNVWASHKHASSFLWHNYNKQLSPSLKESNYLATRWKLFSLRDATDSTPSPSCLDLRETGRTNRKLTKCRTCYFFSFCQVVNDVLIEWGDLKG